MGNEDRQSREKSGGQRAIDSGIITGKEARAKEELPLNHLYSIPAYAIHL